VVTTGYHYAVFWTPSLTNASVRHASISRRNLSSSSAWETFALTDYNQTDDDGHNVYVLSVFNLGSFIFFVLVPATFIYLYIFSSFTSTSPNPCLCCAHHYFLRPSISLGISPTDGTLHLGFDQHDNPLRYRVSRPGITTAPSRASWNASIFGPILVGFLLYLILFHLDILLPLDRFVSILSFATPSTTTNP
jgi:hypothetical protein